MATRGRKPGFVMSDEHRTKIANSQVLRVLIAHAEGRGDMSASQVTAGIALLRKVMPDLQAVELSGETTTNVVSRQPLTAEEWAAQHAAEDDPD